MGKGMDSYLRVDGSTFESQSGYGCIARSLQLQVQGRGGVGLCGSGIEGVSPRT